MKHLSEVDPATQEASRRFIAALVGKFDVTDAYLFGSRARGDAHDESDADIAVILRGKTERLGPTVMALSDLAFDVELELNDPVSISAIPIWLEHWERPETHSNASLIENIKREGIALL